MFISRLISNKGHGDLRENERRHQDKKLDSTNRRSRWYRISTMDWRNKLGVTSYLYYNDRRPRPQYNYISIKEFANSVAIVSVSAFAFGAGIAQCIAKFFGGHG
jgi:hypothetical protein